MKLDTELKPGDIVLLKGLGCVLIVVLFMQLLIFPGLNKHEDLSASLEAKTAQKQEMEDAIANMPAVEETIAKQEETLKAAQDQYYGLMENQEIDELVTGVVLNHSLFPVFYTADDTVVYRILPIHPCPFQCRNNRLVIEKLRKSSSLCDALCTCLQKCFTAVRRQSG